MEKAPRPSLLRWMTSGEYDDLIIVTMIGIKITDEEKYKKMMAQGPFLVFAETLEVGTELKVKHCFTFYPLFSLALQS